MRSRYYISFDVGANYSEFFPSNEPKLSLVKESGEIFMRWKVDKFHIGRTKNNAIYDTIYSMFFDYNYFGTDIYYKINVLGTDKFFFIDPLTSGNINSQNAVYESTPDTIDCYRPILQQYDRKFQNRVADTLFGLSSSVDYPKLNTASFVNETFTSFTDVAGDVDYTNTANAEKTARNLLDVLTTNGDIVMVVIKNFIYVGAAPKLSLKDAGAVHKSNVETITANGVYILTQNAAAAAIYVELAQTDLIGGSSGAFNYEIFYPVAIDSGDTIKNIINAIINGAVYMNLTYTIKSTILWNDALPANPPAGITWSATDDYVISATAIWNGLWFTRTDSFTTAKEDIIELSLKDIMGYLKKIRCYWFIDNDGYFRIEHERYFREYSVQADLTSATYAGDKPEVDQRIYRYERADSYMQVNHSENNQSHEDWMAFPVEFPVLQTSKSVKDISFSDITTDFEYVRDNPGDASSSGVILLRTIGVKRIVAIDQSTITATNYYANGKLSWAWLFANYHNYFAEAKTGTINNGVAITYTHVKEYLKQDNIRFRMTTDLDWKRPFTLLEGTGWIESAELNPETGMYKINVGFDPYGIVIFIVDDTGIRITDDGGDELIK